jgi:vancomycin resistance protein VanW
MDDKFLYGRWRSDISPLYKYEVIEKKHYISHEIWGGYIRHNSLFRKIWNQNNKFIAEEYITENHAIMMYQPFIEQKQLYNSKKPNS